MRFDPRLNVSEQAACETAATTNGNWETTCVLLTSAYHVPLAIRTGSGDAFVRPATGDEFGRVVDRSCR